jgi:biopolymer transport protein TolR
MGMAAGRRGNAVVSEINITPMIDVLIVLIVIFMLPHISLVRSYDLHLPSYEFDLGWRLPIVLEINADGSSALNTKRLERATLEEFLHEVYDHRPDKIIYVKASPLVEYGKVIEYVDAAGGAGVKVVALVLPGWPSGSTPPPVY